MGQMALDISLLQLYNLMDYSLLLCVQYREDYINKNPDKFVENEKWGFWEEIEEQKVEEVLDKSLDTIQEENEIKQIEKEEKFINMLDSEDEDEEGDSPQPQASSEIAVKPDRKDQEDEEGVLSTEVRDARHQFLSADGKYIYHIAIIDYL